MIRSWRRAFCTSVHEDRDGGVGSRENHRCRTKPSNPSTPRPNSASSFSCRTWEATAVATPSPLLPTGDDTPVTTPMLQCRTTGDETPVATGNRNRSHVSLLSPSSNPSSPKSPASFSLLKSKLGFSKSSSRCGICSQSVKEGQGSAIFTAECSHAFHFPCVASRADSSKLVFDCPVCGASRRAPSLRELGSEKCSKSGSESGYSTRGTKNKLLKVYNDDEPLISPPISLTGFNTIPESDEHDDDDEEDNGEFKGFFGNTPSPLTTKLPTDHAFGNVEVKLSPEAAIVAVSRGYETHSVVMKVRSPPLSPARRAPVDLVTVLDVGQSMVGGKIEMLKRAMRIVISSLRETDRLSIVAFSSSSKRMLPLRRMTASGRILAWRIVDALCGGSAGEGMSVNDALKKAAKVMEDRRHKNLSSSILVITGRHSDEGHWAYQAQLNENLSPLVVSSTRLEVPVHTISLGGVGACNHALPEDAFARCIKGLLSLSVEDLTLDLGLASGPCWGEITSVYSLSGRPAWLGSGSIRLGDMYAGEEREVLVEIKAPVTSGMSHRTMTVRSRFVDPISRQIRNSEDAALSIPRPLAVRSSNPIIGRLRNVHVRRRGAAESRRLMERNDCAGAQRMLTSARVLLMQYGVGSSDACLRVLDAELADLKRLRRHVACRRTDEVVQKAEPLTPTSAGRAAERLAKVAITRRHMNKVSDLHGFENARF